MKEIQNSEGLPKAIMSFGMNELYILHKAIKAANPRVCLQWNQSFSNGFVPSKPSKPSAWVWRTGIGGRDLKVRGQPARSRDGHSAIEYREPEAETRKVAILSLSR